MSRRCSTAWRARMAHAEHRQGAARPGAGAPADGRAPVRSIPAARRPLLLGPTAAAQAAARAPAAPGRPAAAARGGSAPTPSRPGRQPRVEPGIWVRSCRATIRLYNPSWSVRLCQARAWVRSCPFRAWARRSWRGRRGLPAPARSDRPASAAASGRRSPCGRGAAPQSCSARLPRVALDPAAIAHQGGQRRQGGRQQLAALGPRPHRILDRAQPELPPGGEHQFLD